MATVGAGLPHPGPKTAEHTAQNAQVLHSSYVQCPAQRQTEDWLITIHVAPYQ